MSKKLLFFDIDGTLINFDGTFPESAKEALRRAKENGHEIFLCSGRNRNQIGQELRSFGFDGYVTCAGADVEYHGEIIHQHSMEQKALQTLVTYFETNDMSYVIQCADRMVVTTKNRDRIREIFRVYRKWKRGEKVFPSQVLDDDVEHYHLNYEDAEKAVYFHSGMELETVQNGLSEYFDVTKLSFQDGTTGSGEVTQKGITKAEGMEAVANHLGLKSEDVIAFGDGPNDSEMFDYAGFSVAMGNAIPELKERADYITTDILDDGIYNALWYLELI